MPASTSALPSIIGPASAVVRPQKSQGIGGAGWFGPPSFVAVKLVTPHQKM
jgi:hypothetical protein